MPNLLDELGFTDDVYEPIEYSADPQPMPADEAYAPYEPPQTESSLSDLTSPPRRRRRTRESLELERESINRDFEDPTRGDTLESMSGWERAVLGGKGQSGGTMLAQLGGVRSFLFNDEEGQKMTERGNAIQREYADLGTDADGQSVAGNFIQDFSHDFISSAAPSVAVGGALAGGLAVAGATAATAAATITAGMAMTAAAQSAGSYMNAATDAYEADGYSREDALKMARPIAALAGAITAGLTILVPGGTKRLIAKVASGEISKVGASNLMREVVKEALLDFPEEAGDQIAQGFAERWTYNPNKPLWEIGMEAWQAGSMGSLAAGLVGTATAPLRLGGTDRSPQQDQVDALVAEARQEESKTPEQKINEHEYTISSLQSIKDELQNKLYGSDGKGGQVQVEIQSSKDAEYEGNLTRRIEELTAEIARIRQESGGVQSDVRSDVPSSTPDSEQTVPGPSGTQAAPTRQAQTLGEKIFQSFPEEVQNGEMWFQQADGTWKLEGPAQRSRPDRFDELMASAEAPPVAAEVAPAESSSQLSDAAQNVFNEAKSTADEFSGVDATSLSPQERRALANAGISFSLNRENRVIATYPARLRVDDLRNAVTSRRSESPLQTQPEVDIQSVPSGGAENAVIQPEFQETPANVEAPPGRETLPDSSQSVPVVAPPTAPTVDEFLSDPPTDDSPFPLDEAPAPAPTNQVGVSRKRKQVAEATTETPSEKTDADLEFEGATKRFKTAEKQFKSEKKGFQNREITEKQFLAAGKDFDNEKRLFGKAERRFSAAKKAEKRAANRKEKGVSRLRGKKRYDYPPDFVDWFGLRTLRRLKPNEKSDFSDSHRKAQSLWSDRFTDDGERLDLVAQEYSDEHRMQTYQFGPQELLDRMINDHGAREGFREQTARGERELKQSDNFENIVKAGKRRDQKNVRQVPAGKLNEGDTFKVQGVPFEVGKIEYADEDHLHPKSIRLHDSDKFGSQTVTPGETLNIDKRSLKKDGTAPSFENDPFEGSLDESAGAAPEPSTEVQAKGIAQIRETINKSNLSPLSKRIANFILDSPVFQDAVWDKLQFAFSNTLPAGLVGSRTEWMVRVREDAGPTVTPEEIFHVLFDLLPAEHKAALEEARLMMLPDDAPEAIRAGTMTTAEFQKSGLDKKWYKFRTASEFAAMAFADNAARAAIPASTWGKIVQYFKGLIEAIKRALGDTDARAMKIVDDINAAVLAGKVTLDPNGMLGVEEEGSLVRDHKQSEKAAKLARDAEIEVEGRSQMAQGSTILDLLKKHGVADLSKSVQAAFRYRTHKAATDNGTALNGGTTEDYRALMERTDIPQHQKNQFARETAQQVLRTGQQLRQNVELGKQATAERQSNAVRRLESEVAKAETMKDVAAEIGRQRDAFLKTAILKFRKMLSQEAKSDKEIAEIEGEINGLDEAAGSGIAMSRLMDDMVATLAKSDEGQAALDAGVSPRETLALYRRMKKGFNETPPASSEPLLRWASYILSKSPELRNLHAAALNSRDSEVRKGMSDYEQELLSGLRDKTASTVNRILADTRKSEREIGKAKWTWLQLRKPLLRLLRKLEARREAGETSEQILADDEWTSFESEVLKDAGYAGPTDVKGPTGDAVTTFTNPAGTSIDLQFGKMGGGNEEFKPLLEQALKWLEETEEWLTQNPEHPLYDYFSRQQNFVRDFFASRAVTTPSNRAGAYIFRGFMGTIMNLADRLGGRYGAIIRARANDWDRLYRFQEDWRRNTEAALVRLRISAIKAQGIPFSFVIGRSLETASNYYQAQVANDLNASWQRQGGGYNIGDMLDSGRLVTKEDMALMKFNAGREKIAVNKMTELLNQTVEDSALTGKEKAFRKPLETSEYMLGRRFDPEVIARFADKNSAITGFAQTYAEALESGDFSKVQKALDDLFPEHGKAFVSDRSADFSEPTIFDEGGIFAAVRNLMATDPTAITDMQSLAEELAARSGVEVEEALAIINKEFGRSVATFAREVDEMLKGDVAPKAGQSDVKNQYTVARNRALAPYTFYRYGLANAEAVTEYSAGMHQVPRATLIQSLQGILADIDRQAAGLKKRVRELTRLGEETPDKTALSENKIAKDQDKTYDDWVALDSRRAAVENMLTELEQTHASDVANYSFDRSISLPVRFLIGNTLTMLRNVSTINLGVALSRVTRSHMFMAQLKAIAIGIPTSVEVIGNAVGIPTRLPSRLIQHSKNRAAAIANNKSLIRVIADALATGFPRSLIEMAMAIPKKWEGDPDAGKLNRVFTDMISAWIDYWERDFKTQWSELDEAGADNRISMRDRPSDSFRAKMAGGLATLATGGRIPSKDLGTVTKLYGATLGLFELAADFINAPLPGIGDAAQNLMNLRAANADGFGPNSWRSGLERVFKAIKDGKRSYNFNSFLDPINNLSAKELGALVNTLSANRNAYQEVSLDFDRMAHDYLVARAAQERTVEESDVDGIKSTITRWKKSKEPKPDFANEKQLNDLSRLMLAKSNIKTPSRTVLRLERKDMPTKTLSLLLGWNTRTFHEMARFNSIPWMSGRKATTIGGVRWNKARQWGVHIGTVLIPFLLLGAAFKRWEDEETRFLKKALFNQESQRRRPWEEETTKGMMLSFARDGLEVIPFIGGLANLINPSNAPARASLQPSFVALNMLQAGGEYINTVMNTGSWTYGLPAFLARVIPDSKIFINRMDQFEGNRDRNNMLALAKRLGPQDLVKPPYGGGTPNLTGLTPYGRLMENYALTGNRDKFVETYNRAIAKATELGKPDPEKLVNQLFQGRNPVNAAFTNKLTPEQHAAMLGKMSDDERNRFMTGEQAFAAAADWIGVKTPTYFRTRAASSPTRKSSGAGGSRASSQSFGTAPARRASVSGRISGVSRLRRPRRLTARTSRAASRSVLRRGRRRPTRSRRRSLALR